MSEPDQWLSHIEQEERRRTFWSSYLIDKLISCGRSRPVVIHDEDCNVQLPCDEQTFNTSQWKKTNTLDQLLNWNMEIAETPSPFALVILMASIFGRCTRYVHQNRKEDEIPPWDTKSEYAAINSSLLLLESYSNVSGLRISDIVQGRSPPSEAIDQQQVGHFIFAHTLFHLCHCLLNHPFLVRMRLKAFGTKAPVSFSARSLQSSCAHARQLMDLLREATESGCLIESSFYAYCIAVAGGIHSLACHFEQQNVVTQESDGVHYFQQSMDALESLADLWVHAANMFDRLREFHSISHRFANLLDPSCLAEELDSFSQEVLWSMIDYRILGSDPHKKPLTDKPATPNMATMWALESNALSPTHPRFDGASPDIFGALTPTMRLNEVEYLLNCSPGANGIV
ncbi:hypothetical protein N7478_005908 [Penicillium angulare]|uniref:uncharacterized protein n=1 Tax=Penicillium angulare TaxID=116970 RepID=UPI00254222CE|nr:uncharacterized protein N7478_005908 [Penicillium angulare]KAJ5280536.1 hypothetical protein N7478_005908 [Penicillium angulare]